MEKLVDIVETVVKGGDPQDLKKLWEVMEILRDVTAHYAFSRKSSFDLKFELENARRITKGLDPLFPQEEHCDQCGHPF